MKPTPLKGIIAAALTPVDDQFGVDVPRLVDHLQALLAAGCSMVSTFGTTGEGVSLSAREKHKAHKDVIRAGIPADRILPAIMACSVDDAAAQLADIAGLGCHYCLILPPFYYPGDTGDGLLLFFEEVYRRAGHPDIEVLLYNIPALSRIQFTNTLVQRLLDRGRVPVAGIKDSTGDLQNGLDLVAAFPQLAIFTGDDRVLSPLVDAGGAGMIGGLPNLYAADLVALLGAGGDQRQRLVRQASQRIADVDSRGGLVALKADLSKRLGDPAWRRLLPPQSGHSNDSAL